jgi:hypothetical protein
VRNTPTQVTIRLQCGGHIPRKNRAAAAPWKLFQISRIPLLAAARGIATDHGIACGPRGRVTVLTRLQPVGMVGVTMGGVECQTLFVRPEILRGKVYFSLPLDHA